MLLNTVWLIQLVLGAAGLIWLLLLARFVRIRLKALSGQSWWSDFPKYSPFLLLLLGVLVIGLLSDAATKIWVIREQGTEARCVQYYLLGSYEYAFQNGQTAHLAALAEAEDPATDPNRIVVNDTTRRLQLRLVQYGVNVVPDAVPEEIAPMTARPVPPFEHCGPDNPPPATVKGYGPVSLQLWLTW